MYILDLLLDSKLNLPEAYIRRFECITSTSLLYLQTFTSKLLPISPKHWILNICFSAEKILGLVIQCSDKILISYLKSKEIINNFVIYKVTKLISLSLSQNKSILYNLHLFYRRIYLYYSLSFRFEALKILFSNTICMLCYEHKLRITDTLQIIGTGFEIISLLYNI